jgi:hypothetical protein
MRPITSTGRSASELALRFARVPQRPSRSATAAPLLLLFVLACGDTVPTPLEVPAVALSSECPLEIKARVHVAAEDVDCPLTPVDGAFEGSCSIRASGKVSLELQYWSVSPELVIAQAEAEVLVDETNTDPIVFAAEQLTYPDQDNDGLSSLDELCLDRDPTIADRPRFEGVVHEQGAIAVRFERYTIGERVRILGADLPSAEQTTVSVGPMLDGSRIAVTPISVSPTAIVVQLPPGLDTGGVVEIAVEAFGERWSEELSVSRVWGVGSRAEPGVFLFAEGGYASPSQELGSYKVSFERTSCPLWCLTRIWGVSTDGRQLVASARATDSELFVVDIPSGQVWSGVRNWPSGSSFALVEDDTYLASVDPVGDILSVTRFRAAEQRIDGSISARQAVAGAQMLAALDDLLYVFTHGVGGDAVHRFRVSEGQLSALGNALVLPRSCPQQGCGEVSLQAVTETRLVLAREALNQVDLIDLDSGATLSASIERPQSVAVAPRSRDRVAVSNLNDLPEAGDQSDVGVCLLPFDAFEAPAEGCTLIDSRAEPTSVAIVPEETRVLVSKGGLGVSIPTYTSSLPLAPLARIYLGQSTYSFAIQP